MACIVFGTHQSPRSKVNYAPEDGICKQVSQPPRATPPYQSSNSSSTNHHYSPLALRVLKSTSSITNLQLNVFDNKKLKHHTKSERNVTSLHSNCIKTIVWWFPLVLLKPTLIEETRPLTPNGVGTWEKAWLM